MHDVFHSNVPNFGRCEGGRFTLILQDNILINVEESEPVVLGMMFAHTLMIPSCLVSFLAMKLVQNQSRINEVLNLLHEMRCWSLKIFHQIDLFHPKPSAQAIVNRS